MNIGKALSWAFVALMAVVPLNWVRLWAAGEIPKDATVVQFAIGTLICWGVAAGLSYFLIMSARGVRLVRAKEEAEFQLLLSQPLTEIQPTKALMKADEKAYGAVMASLQEIKTVGYSAGTTGVSLRVARGLSLRTSGTQGRAVKGAVIVATGELVITDKRVIFAGDRKSFAIPIESLLSTTNYSDGFGFSNNDSTYTLLTDNDGARMRFAIALQKVLRS